MITGEYWKLHDDETLAQIDGAAVRLLSRNGVRIEHEGLLDQLEGAGCRVERSGRRCFFPERLVRDAVAHLGGRCTEAITIPTGWGPRRALGHCGSYPHLLEWPGGERRLATRHDVLDMARMAHALDEFGVVGRVLTCSEVDPRIEPLWTTLQLAETTDKPIGGGEIFFSSTIEPLVRMGEVLRGEAGRTSLVASCDFFIAPLIFDRRQAECFLEKRRFGIENVPGTMPISGMSAPVTIAGTVTVAVAELLAGWTMGYVVCPELPAGGIVSSGSLDLRTATACFGSPEAMLQDAATVQLCRRLYGIPVHAAIGYTDARTPGLDAVFQKLYPLVGAPFGTGRTLPCDGLLSAGQDYSPVQQLLEAEMSGALERFWGGFEVNEETIAVELIEELARRPATNFLDTGHTATHFRGEQWYPQWFQRGLWRGTAVEVEGEQRMLERMAAHGRDAIRRYERPDLDAVRLAEVRRIFAAAERDILGSGR